MSTVAIIHAAEDALPARALAEKLRQAKLTVVLEKQPGDELRGAVKDAKVTVALWSPRALQQQALLDDAGFARNKSKLVHAIMQNAETPEAFRADPIVNLTGWRGEDEYQAWRDLAKLVTDRAGVAALPPPAPKPPSGFFQPGVVNAQAEAAATARAPAANPGASAGSPTTPRAAPQQRPPQPAPAPRPAAAPRQAAPPPAAPQARQAPPPRQEPPPRQTPPRQAAAPPVADAPAKSGGGGLVIGLIAAVVVLGLGGGGYYFFSQSQGASATATAWDTIDQTDVNALRNFLDGDPGDYRDEAQTALASLEQSRYAAARSEDSIAAYESFLNDFPSSENAIAARGRIAELGIEQPAATDPALVDPAAGQTLPPEDLVPPNATAPGGDAGPPSIASPPAPEPEPSAEPEPLPTN